MFQPKIPNIYSFFTDEYADPDSLWPEERGLTTGFAPDRMQSFAAGRYCARNALTLMGHPTVAIPVGDDRAPVWPAGIAGSISHTRGLAGALVCSFDHHPSIGLDIERRTAVDQSLWDMLFDEREQASISAAESPEERATLYFSMKEAYYKMQYPLTRRFLDFLEVRIEDGPDGLYIQRLKVLPEAAPRHLTGHLQTQDYIITWVLATL